MWRTGRRVFPVVLALGLLFCACGCEHYNRADITPDGKRLAFALNKEGGFGVDDSSELYVLTFRDDTNRLSIKRLTRNQVADSWVAFSPDGQNILGVRLEPMTISTYHIESAEEMPIAASGLRYFDFPLYLDDEQIFYAALRQVASEGDGSEIVCRLLSTEKSGSNELVTDEELVTIPWREKERLWSTTPAFGAGVMYYAVARVIAPEDDVPEGSAGDLLNVTFYELDMETKLSREICALAFTMKGDIEKSPPVGMADLALSPDGKTLLVCFLPGEGFSLEGFDDQQPSNVYIIDMDEEAPSARPLGEFYMYYPQFAPSVPAEESDGNEDVAGAIVFLSGAGYGDAEAGGRSVYIMDFAARMIELARFPDKVMGGYTGWAWLNETRLRIFHIGAAGLSVVDVNRDGSGRVERCMDTRDLVRLKNAADAVAALDGFMQEYEFTLEEFTRITGREDLGIESNAADVLRVETERLKGEAADVVFSEGAHPATPTPTSRPAGEPADAGERQ